LNYTTIHSNFTGFVALSKHLQGPLKPVNLLSISSNLKES
jgi:hypothetical protein